MVRKPSTRLDRLKQLKPQAGVAAGATLASAAPAADRPTMEVTATPAASTEHALAKRLRIEDSFLFREFARRTAFPGAAWAVRSWPVTAGDDTATNAGFVALCYPV